MTGDAEIAIETRDNKETETEVGRGNQEETVPETQTHSWARKVAKDERVAVQVPKQGDQRKQEGEQRQKSPEAQTETGRKKEEAGRGKGSRKGKLRQTVRDTKKSRRAEKQFTASG